MLRFHVADALTGEILGSLEPSSWSITDPLTGQGDLTLTVPVPLGHDALLARLADLTRPKRRQVCVEDDESGRFLFGGPIPNLPARGDDGTLTIRAVDWRGWLHRMPVPPWPDGSRNDYFAADVEQVTIVGAIAYKAIEAVGAPNMVLDNVPAVSGITRRKVVRMFTPVGSALDEMAQLERGVEWWTYVDRSTADRNVVVAHVGRGWPARAFRSSPIVVRDVRGEGGNGLSHVWPEMQERPNVVYGVGSGTPPDQGWAVAEGEAMSDADDGGPSEVVWPEVMSLPSGTITSKQAYEAAQARLDALSSEDGTVDVTVDPRQPPVGDYDVGDLARLIVRDGWRDVDQPTTRIVARNMSGFGPHVTDVTLTLDLAYTPDVVEDTPGEEVTE